MGTQIPTGITIINSLKGYQALSLNEYATSAAASIAAGSIVEIAGAFFQFTVDETPTGWSAISTGSTAYIALTASGTAGSQIVDASYTGTAPAWRDDLQGWYASAASSVRIVASVYKTSATSYTLKYILEKHQESNITSRFIQGSLTTETSINAGTSMYAGTSLTVGSCISAGLDIYAGNIVNAAVISAASSLTIAGDYACAVSNSATSETTVLPIGSIIILVMSAASTLVNVTVNPRTPAGYNAYYDNSYTASTGTLLSGTWKARGNISSNVCLAQRSS
jgi:hypothetical protein